MKTYSAALNRYLSAAKGIEMAWLAPLLGKLFKMNDAAAFTPPPDAEEDEAEKMTEDQIVKNVHRTYHVGAKKMNRAPKRQQGCQLER